MRFAVRERDDGLECDVKLTGFDDRLDLCNLACGLVELIVEIGGKHFGYVAAVIPGDLLNCINKRLRDILAGQIHRLDANRLCGYRDTDTFGISVSGELGNLPLDTFDIHFRVVQQAEAIVSELRRRIAAERDGLH